MPDYPHPPRTEPWERPLWHDFLIVLGGLLALAVVTVGLAWLVFRNADVALGRAESANARCEGHGGVQSTGGRGPSVVTCNDGSAHDLPVWVSRDEWRKRHA